MKRRSYAALSSAIFMNGLGSNIQLGIWPFYLRRNNVGDELYGGFSSAGTLVGIVARVISARLGSANESLPLAVGILASASMLLMYALLPNPLGIAIGMCLSAVSVSLVMVGRTTLVGRAAGRKVLGTAYASLITLANVGLIIGTNIGAIAFAFTNYMTVFLLGGLICSVGLFIALLWLPRESMPHNSRVGTRLRDMPPNLRMFYLAVCMDAFSWNIALPFYSITPVRIFPQATRVDIALIQTIWYGASTAATLAFGILSDRSRSRKSILAFSEGLGVSTMLLYLLAPNISLIFVSSMLCGLSISGWSPIAAAYMSEASTRQELHDNVSTWFSLTAIVSVPAPIIGGYLAEHWFPRAPYLISAILIGLTSVYIQKCLKDPNRNLQ